MQKPDASEIPLHDASTEKLIFQAATFIPDVGERDEYLEVACQGNSALRERIHSLLRAAEADSIFMRKPAIHSMVAEPPIPTDSAMDTSGPTEHGTMLCPSCRNSIKLSPGETPHQLSCPSCGSCIPIDWQSTSPRNRDEILGTQIGPYKLLEQIGEGGMGVVYLAEQQAPVRRRVALKVIKAGMDTRQAIARFQAERQALALMDHPNIARVFDAGSTESGRLYFVMELVHGISITEYCDQHNLSVHERLEHLVEVCLAVQHAHQKGIIHRDLKPSNVLVTEQDGLGVPKVIDFGLVKAAGHQLTENTLLTAFPQMIGTPLYMSPEQAETTALDIDTRADIYSLGVLLYELLTGATPFDRARFHSSDYDEIRRVIREEEPPRPSLRIGLMGEAGAATAAHRGTDLRRLRQRVQGDLDWIVMRCLEKDRTRRYGTASALAADLERYLRNEPVEACPPTAGYRLRKFVRRNTAGVLVGLAFVALVVTAGAVLGVNNARIRRESEARAKALQAKETSLATVRRALRQVTQLDAQLDARISGIPGGDEIWKAVREDMLRYLGPIAKQAELDEESKYEAFVILESMADIQMDIGRYNDARQTAQRAVDIVQGRLDEDPRNPLYLADLGRAKNCMVRIMASQLTSDNEAECAAYCTELADLLREFNRRHPDNLQPTAYCLKTLGDIALQRHGDRVAAECLFREGVSTGKRYLQQEPSDTFERLMVIKNAKWLAYLLQHNPDAGPQEAAPMFEQALRWSIALEEASPSQWTRQELAHVELWLGICCFHLQRSDDAIALIQRASAELRRQSVQRGNLYLWQSAQGTLVRQLQQVGRDADAAEAARQMADWLNEVAPMVSEDARVHGDLQLAQIENVGLLSATGQIEVAVHACRQHISFWEAFGRDKPSEVIRPYLAGSYLMLIRSLTAIGQVDEAKRVAAQADEIGLTDPQTLSQLARSLINAKCAEKLPLAHEADPAVAELAVQAAESVTSASPDDGRSWNMLGAAQYFDGQWQGAIHALEKSMDLRGGGDASDWFFTAMSHRRLDHRMEARAWYDRAVEWMEKNESKDHELVRFRAVATELIGISPSPPQAGAKHHDPPDTGRIRQK